jgi:hypothetical protein
MAFSTWPNGESDEHEHRKENGEHQIVHRQVRLQRQHTQQASARYTLQPVLAAGERRLQADEIHQLRQGECDHGEINALAADRDCADRQAESRGDRCPGQDRRRRPPGVRGDQP